MTSITYQEFSGYLMYNQTNDHIDDRIELGIKQYQIFRAKFNSTIKKRLKSMQQSFSSSNYIQLLHYLSLQYILTIMIVSK